MTDTTPWARVKHPLAIPVPCSALVLRLMPAAAFAELLRSNLLPGQDKDGFRDLWITLAFNDDLSGQTFDVLEGWLEMAEKVPAEDPQAARARKFQRSCTSAWDRLTGVREFDIRPDRFVPGPDTVAGRFIAGIDQHRSVVGDKGTELDHALWATLSNARDRGRRGREVTKNWEFAPVLTTQLIDAVTEHQRLTETARSVDRVLWGLLD